MKVQLEHIISTLNCISVEKKLRKKTEELHTSKWLPLVGKKKKRINEELVKTKR
jgi:hypothetical protein